MKTTIILIGGLISLFAAKAQDTVYISRDKVTALYFNQAVKLVSNPQQAVQIEEKGKGLLTIRAAKPFTHPVMIAINNIRDHEVYQLPVVYSFGRAGRSLRIHGRVPVDSRRSKLPQYNAQIADVLLNGSHSDIAARKREGKIKAWVNKISIAGNRLFFRLDVRNKSNLPYDIDFIRFYIRDKKTVARMASHEQEIIPVFKTNGESSGISPHKEGAFVFAFSRFPLNNDQLLSVEIYERRGNRNLVIQLDSGDFEDAQPVYIPQNN